MLEEFLKARLKDRLVKQGSIINSDFIEPNKEESRLFFYLNKYEKNLVAKMHPDHIAEYSKGGGQELFDKSTPAKMKSLHSSSALTFNLIGNKSVIVKDNKYGIKSGKYSVQFEKKLKTLKGTSPATLDACLLSDDKSSCVFCEMKMFEWLTTRKAIVSESYNKSNMYYDQNAFKVFENIFKQHRNSKQSTRYDEPQMLKHSLGIFNTLKNAQNNADHEFFSVKKVTLLNCVWEVCDIPALGKISSDYTKIVNEEHDGYQLFRSKYQPVIDLFKDKLQIDLQLCYLTHKQFIDMLDKTLAEQNYLQRYCI